MIFPKDRKKLEDLDLEKKSVLTQSYNKQRRGPRRMPKASLGATALRGGRLRARTRRAGTRCARS